MKIALPTFNGRISPVFDTAQRLILVEVNGTNELSRGEHAIQSNSFARRAAHINELGIEILLCGAISRPLAMMIAAQGIEVVPFISGEVDEVLGAYLQGRLAEPKYFMPGCCGRRRQFRGGFGGRKGGGKRGRNN
jgi:predicted Fe-Mo cluster-binding NifX family protein